MSRILLASSEFIKDLCWRIHCAVTVPKFRNDLRSEIPWGKWIPCLLVQRSPAVSCTRIILCAGFHSLWRSACSKGALLTPADWRRFWRIVLEHWWWCQSRIVIGAILQCGVFLGVPWARAERSRRGGRRYRGRCCGCAGRRRSCRHVQFERLRLVAHLTVVRTIRLQHRHKGILKW